MTPLERAAKTPSPVALATKEVERTLRMFNYREGNLAEHRALVRAVLQAIREPSESMVTAASENAQPISEPGAWSYPDDLARAHWQSMIDAALADK